MPFKKPNAYHSGEAVKALVLRTAGTNCDQETINALTKSGADCDRVHVNQLLTGRVRIHPYLILVLPGGFSYGDDISAGKVLANELLHRLNDQLARFIETKKLVIGICNGFQVLVKSGLLPGFDTIDKEQTVTLTLNDSARFQCEWVSVRVEPSQAAWLKSMPKRLDLPIAHAEGRFIAKHKNVLTKLKTNKQIFLRYHPANPNGSEEEIAGICNKTGNVIGMMPHPERYLSRYQHPAWTRQKENNQTQRGGGFWFWKDAVDYAKTFLH